MKIIAVGSENPVKISAVKNVMEKLIGDVKVYGVKVSSGAPPQPIGLSQTLEGAESSQCRTRCWHRSGNYRRSGKRRNALP
jgi:non-canonical (house-cleaning) NTP pyrophosphatase